MKNWRNINLATNDRYRRYPYDVSFLEAGNFSACQRSYAAMANTPSKEQVQELYNAARKAVETEMPI